ncbi:hypothetical protein BGZ83_005882 [Gryganskiella cystojenkinii]|nr:hypothetical protein BGZ83_005882 [Gryganskiella cystojenkinii]
MVSADLILASVSATLFGALFLQFAYRFSRSRWWIYFFCSFFCAIRIAGYGLRAFLASDASPEYGTTTWINYYIAELVLMSIGVIFILLILARLYHSILPKLRYRGDGQEPRSLFERTLVDHTRVFLLPIIACVIAGGVLTSDQDPQKQNISLILRKVSSFGLFAVGLLFMAAAVSFRRRYSDHPRPFTIAVAVSGLFLLSLIYKIVALFNAAALSSLAASYICSTLLELIALGFLCGDLQTYFLGHKADQIPKGVEFK